VDADLVKERYELKGERAPVLSKGLAVFRDSCERFKSRVRANQKEKSTWMVTRWAIHDNAQLAAVIRNISSLLDSLESTANSLGLLEQRQALLNKDIESISDVQSLRLLRDATSLRSGHSSQPAISDAASQRLTIFESAHSRRRIYSSHATASIRSYYISLFRKSPHS